MSGGLGKYNVNTRWFVEHSCGLVGFEELRLAKILRDLGIPTWMFSITRYE